MKLTVSVAQMRVARCRPEENLRKGQSLIAEAARRKSGLICFPEMWTTGLDWKYCVRAAADHEKTINAVGALAKKYGIWVSGSMSAPASGGKVANSHILFDAGGRRAGVYGKTHLFSPLNEGSHVAAGDCLCVVDAPWGPTALTVCYDIRFPELFRAYALKGATVVLSPMAMPHPRLAHWKVLSRARAIEDQLFFIGANQVGSEDFGARGTVTYFGSSVIIDPWGETVAEAGETDEELLTATIDLARVDEVRAAIPVLKDRRPDLYGL